MMIHNNNNKNSVNNSVNNGQKHQFNNKEITNTKNKTYQKKEG